MLDPIKKLIGGRMVSRDEDPVRSTRWTTPWAWRDEEGVYVGWNGEVWIYRRLPLAPIAAEWEDPGPRLDAGRPIQQVLTEIGQMSKESVTGLRQLNSNREIHILAVTSEVLAQPPDDTPDALEDYLSEVLGFLIPVKTLLVGVRLIEASAFSSDQGAGGLVEGLKKAISRPLGEDIPDVERFANDRRAVASILTRAGASVPTVQELRLMESWYNMGLGTDAVVIEQRDRLVIDQTDALEMAVVHKFHDMVNYAPYYQWASEAEAHPEGVRLISVRAELEPAMVSRKRARQSQRRIRAQIDEEAATGDIDRPEYSNTYQLAAAVEEHFVSTNEPLLTNCSIVLARRASLADETYIDMLRNNHAIEVRPLPLRQLDALDETLPCSSKRVNPFLHDLTIGMLAYAGLHGFSALGDPNGIFMGVTHPNMTPAYLEPLGAPRRNKAPSMAIFGDPGSGKALADDELVATASGWRPMGSIAVGDEVIGADGRPTPVTAVYPQGVRPIKAVRFDDGTVVRADEDHLWVVAYEGDGERGRGPWVTLTTAEIAATLRAGACWQVPIVGAVHYAGPGVDIDDALAALDAGRDSRDLVAAPIAQRRAAVASLARRGAWRGRTVRITVPGTVVGAVRSLVEGLGGVVRSGAGIEHVDGSASEEAVLLLSLDQETWAEAGGEASRWRPPQRSIVSVEEDGEAMATCIAVTARDHLFVTAGHVVTHNTYLCQLIAYQATLAGLPVIFINPKGFDSLSPLAELAGGQVVSMSRLEAAIGAFDPCRYVPPDQPELAAEIATTHILSVLTEFTEPQELALSFGLLRGMQAGAACVRDALAYVEDPEVVRLVLQQAQTSPTFALGVGVRPGGRIDLDRRLTLIEFDRKLDLPERGKDVGHYTRSERIALAAIRIVTRASMEILASLGGGVLILDEAWTFLSSSAGVAALQQLGREGRSLNVLPVFATQRVADLLNYDMEGYLSRVMVMSLAEAKEAIAALQLCGLEATESRLEWLKHSGPRQGSVDSPDRWAMGLHRDLDNRHAAVLVGPVPAWTRRAITTNPEERKRIQEQQAAQLAASDRQS